jgi:hypothetical protein
MGCNRRGFWSDSLELCFVTGPFQPPSVWGTHYWHNGSHVHFRPGMVMATLCGRRPASGRPRVRAALTGVVAICLAPGLGHPRIRDPRRSQGFRIGITHCKQKGTGVGDKFCTPIQVEMKMFGLGLVKRSPMEHWDVIINYIEKRIAEADQKLRQRRRDAD